MYIQTLQAFLGWCTVLNFGLLVFTGIILAAAGDLIYPIHKAMFSISRDEFYVANYRWLGSYKVAVIALCLVPWIALKIIAYQACLQRSKPSQKRGMDSL